MRKIYRVHLTETEQAICTKIIKSRSSKNAVTRRAKVLLSADENGLALQDKEISSRYEIQMRTIERIRERFIEEGFESTLYGKKRELFKEKVLDGKVEAYLIAMRCGAAPKGHKKWTLRLLAEHMVLEGYVEEISHESVRQMLKKIK